MKRKLVVIEVIDNFLPEEEFKSIQSLLVGGQFNWYYSDRYVSKDDGGHFMCHMFYHIDVGANSSYVGIWDTFMTKVESKKCMRIKANLTFKTSEPDPTSYHIDINDMKTAIFYINTNNGYTEFENGVRVNSVSNRVCIFDSNLQHRGVTHTEGDPQRIVVNFNYDKSN